MNHYTMNAACKHPKSIRFGGRRRQCVSCHATWRIRSKKRGPKAIKRRTTNLERTFVGKYTIAQQSDRSSLSANALAKRHASALTNLCERPWPHRIPKGRLILVMDAIWFKKDEDRHTVYLTGLRRVEDDTLHFLRPILRPGSESQERWREVIGLIPRGALKRICAIVSDSFAGSGGIAKEHGWIFQRCQAHLLLRLEALCGDVKRKVSFWEGRQELKRVTYALMNTRDENKAAKLADELMRLGEHRECPKYLRYAAMDTIRHLHEYRACYLHPELRLPATTNALENTNCRIRSLLNRSRGCRTPESLIRWITGFLWFNPMVKCRPKLPTEIKR